MDRPKVNEEKHVEQPDISHDEDVALDAVWRRMDEKGLLSQKAKEAILKGKRKKAKE